MLAIENGLVCQGEIHGCGRCRKAWLESLGAAVSSGFVPVRKTARPLSNTFDMALELAI
jgi:hypothetical protein